MPIIHGNGHREILKKYSPVSKSWCLGYISALVDNKTISYVVSIFFLYNETSKRCISLYICNANYP